MLWLLFILLIGTLFGVASCMKIDKSAEWYSEETLADRGLENLPRPDFQYKGYYGMSYRIDGMITENNFDLYAQRILDYMNVKYENFGTVGEAIEPNSNSPKYRYVECERELENYRYETQKENGTIESIHYLFVYFREDPGSTSYSTSWKIEISYYLEEQTNRIQNDEGNVKELYKYNFCVGLRKFGVSIDYVLVDKYLEESYEKQYPNCGKASVLHYYNRNNLRDHFAVMITATNMGYDQALWTENVGDYTFHYPDGNRILVSNDYFNTTFYTLTERYEAGWLDDSELANIEAQHRKFYPELYATEQGS